MAGRFLLSIILPALMITRCSALVAGSAPRWARRACRAASTTTTTMSTATSNAAAAAADTPPVSLLAGFLGSGKTTLLTNILENREGLRVGVIVNDVAAVNVDALTIRKLLPSANGEVDMIELENGCVCCGPEAGQLAPAVRKLVKTAKARGAPFDQIVIELSGVADPGMVKFHLSKGGVETDRVVTLVDGSAFPSLYHSSNEMGERDDLSGGEKIVKADPCVPRRKVVELLVQQLEEADVTVVNKDDIATEDELESTLAVCAALNPKSAVTQTNFGNVPLRSVLSVGEAAVGAAAAGAAVGTQQAPAAAAAAEQTFMVKGINCGGCKKALTAALDAVESLEIVSIAHKGETGNAANPVVVKGVAVEAFQAALAELDGK
jgi:G3E family GTPase